MLQRAAGNAYSWWWAGHIRTKQSKWLEQSLQDMEEKVEHVLNLIQKDGDSFAKRAEMYYKHRPELIAFVEETVRAYRALAERYDKLSTDLQKANTTIASICPDQVTYDIDDDDEYNDNPPKMPKNFPQNTPKAPKTPKLPNKDSKGPTNNASKTIETIKTTKTMKTDSPKHIPKSGLTKDEALEEIDKLQKEILGLQTMKEFMKSSYEGNLTQYLDAEKKINELQQKVSTLQDEFEISKVIEDNDARNLMAEAALKSCDKTLDKLEKKHEESSQDVKLEHQKIKEAKQKLMLVKHEFDHDQDQLNDQEENLKPKQDEKNEIKDLTKKPQTVTELADTIDKIVNKVISLESSVSSQNAFIDMLRKEADDLQTQIQQLEEDKAVLIDESHSLDEKMKNMEEKLQDLDQNQENSNEINNSIDESAKFKILSLKGEKDELGWRDMSLSGLEDKEKILMEEYITILNKYKDTQKKLSEEEKKNKGIDSQIKQLKSDNDKKDNEIRLLKQKLRLLQENDSESDDLPLESEAVSVSVSAIEEKLRTDIDVILEENLDFWLRFSTAFHQVQKFKTEVEDLQEEVKKVEAKGIEGKSSTSMYTTDLRSDIRPIYKHLKEIKNELTSWLEQSTALKDELHKRCSALSNIQEEIIMSLKKGVEEEEIKFSTHQAAKFQGEILNMKQENNKVNEELEAGLDHVTALKHETEKTLERVEEEFGLSESQSPSHNRRSPSRSGIPLRSFIFGAKPKKQRPSFFAFITHHKKFSAYKGRLL